MYPWHMYQPIGHCLSNLMAALVSNLSIQTFEHCLSHNQAWHRDIYLSKPLNIVYPASKSTVYQDTPPPDAWSSHKMHMYGCTQQSAHRMGSRCSPAAHRLLPRVVTAPALNICMHLLGPVHICIMFQCRLTRMNDPVEASLHRLQVEDWGSIIYFVHIALMKYRGARLYAKTWILGYRFIFFIYSRLFPFYGKVDGLNVTTGISCQPLYRA
jgi:hypothetical protein